MADVNDVLAANRAAVIDLVAAAERSAATWTTPRAPGKWSPSQVVEHVARALEESANVVSGAPSKFGTSPAFLRPLFRLFFYRILKKGAFPKAKANKAFDPTSGPATPAQARVRLEGALARFDQEYLAYIATYTKLHRRPPAEADIPEYLKVTPSSVHNMIVTLDRLQLIETSTGPGAFD